MTTLELHPLARDYVKRLRRAAGALPPAQRTELVEQIEAHLAEALPANASEGEVRSVLDRLGDPDAIVAEAAPDPTAQSRRTREWITIWALLVGGVLLPVVGWLVGLILLWSSRVWSPRDKLVGTLVVPGGLLPLIYMLVGVGQVCSGVVEDGKEIARHCTGGFPGGPSVAIAVAVVLFAGPIGTSILLARRLR